MQLNALLSHFEENEITEKWIETKFLFKGHKIREVEQKLIVANEHCGDGCRFLSALPQEPSLPGGFIDRKFPRGALSASAFPDSVFHQPPAAFESSGATGDAFGYQPDYWRLKWESRMCFDLWQPLNL